MREIKFRAWDKRALELPPAMYHFSFKDAGRYSRCGNIMQYTGLKDKNGNGENELCQDDIVNVFGLGPCRVDKNYWGAWCVIDHSGYECPIHDAVMEQDLGELLGNIHENPELLGDNND